MTEEEDLSPLLAMTAAILVLGLIYIATLCFDLLISYGYFQNWSFLKNSSPKSREVEDQLPPFPPRQEACSRTHRDMVKVLRGTGVWSGYDVVNNLIYEPWTADYRTVPVLQQWSSSDQELLGHSQVVKCEVHENKPGEAPFQNASIISLSSSEDEREASGEETQTHTDTESKVYIREEETTPLRSSQQTVLQESSPTIDATGGSNGETIMNSQIGKVGGRTILPLTEDTMYVRMSSSCHASRPRISSAQEIRPANRKPRFLSERSSSFRLVGGREDSSGNYIEMTSDCSSTLSSIRTTEAECGSRRTSETLALTFLDASITPCRGGRGDPESRYVNMSSDNESNRSSSTRAESGHMADSWSWTLTEDVCPMSSATSSMDRGSEFLLFKSRKVMDACVDSDSRVIRKSGSSKARKESNYVTMTGHGKYLQQGHGPPLTETSGQSGHSVSSVESLYVLEARRQDAPLLTETRKVKSVLEASGQDASLPTETRKVKSVLEASGQDAPLPTETRKVKSVLEGSGQDAPLPTETRKVKSVLEASGQDAPLPTETRKMKSVLEASGQDAPLPTETRKVKSVLEGSGQDAPLPTETRKVKSVLEASGKGLSIHSFLKTFRK